MSLRVVKEVVKALLKVTEVLKVLKALSPRRTIRFRASTRTAAASSSSSQPHTINPKGIGLR